MCSAQSLGEIARQKRTQYAPQATQTKHVFTNEDLTRPKILDGVAQERRQEASPSRTPEASPAPFVQPLLNADRPNATEVPVATMPPARPWPENVPLGDVARLYRKIKEQVAQQKQQPNSRQPNAAPLSMTPRRMVPTRIAPRIEAIPQGVAPAITRATVPTRQLPAQPGRKSVIAIAKEPPREVRVEPGDSLWKLAGRYLGDGNQWKKIAAANPELDDPNRIVAGQQLRLPQATVAQSATQVLVTTGDTLWSLAQSQWGQGQAWSCIAEANPHIAKADRIYPGQLLTIPATCSRA